MELGDYNELRDQLQHEFVLYRKGRLWYLIGGAFAAIVLSGVVSYQAAKSAISSKTVTDAVANLESHTSDAKQLIDEVKVKTGVHPEFELPSVKGTGITGWTDVLQLGARSAVRIEAYTLENNYIQPWVIYAWRAYEEQVAGLHILPIEPLHAHSAAVEWVMQSNGTLQLRTTKYETVRHAKLTEVTLLRGEVEVFEQ